MSWSWKVNQLLDEEEERHNFCQEDEARKERDERTNENAIHEPRLTAVEQTMKKMMEGCEEKQMDEKGKIASFVGTMQDMVDELKHRKKLP